METPKELEQEIHKAFDGFKSLGADVSLISFTDETFMDLKNDLLDLRNFYPSTDRNMIQAGYMGLICGVDCKISHGNMKGEAINWGEVYFYGKIGNDRDVKELGMIMLLDKSLKIPPRHMRNRFEMLELD